MRIGFPSDRAAKRAVLLEAVYGVRDVLLSCADEAEHMATLPPAAAQHFMVNDLSYENQGQFLLGLPDADPMG